MFMKICNFLFALFLVLLGYCVFSGIVDNGTVAGNCEKVEKVMGDYVDYDAVVPCDSYAKKLDVIEHDDYKEITLTTRNELGKPHSIKFLLFPNFSYHLQ